MSKLKEIIDLEREILRLQTEVRFKQYHLMNLKRQIDKNELENPYCPSLDTDEVIRYSRQIIMPNIQVDGQITLKNSRVLIVGAGGLGCPASLYLAAAGIGHITLMDSDCVELSNLHRQVLHNDATVGLPKVLSAKEALKRLNKDIFVQAVQCHLTSENIGSILQSYDVIIDATDNVATRYLLNDSCVIQKRPLVSGSALQMEGQLTVYNYKGGPCYRCLFPIPPPPEAVTSCGDGGVLGAIPGCIGVLQALETVKILLNSPDVLSGRMLIFDGSNTTFRNITLRKRSANCAVCGDNPSVTRPINYEQFCQATAHDKGQDINIISRNNRIGVLEFAKLEKKPLIIDVRPVAEFNMCRLPNSFNLPYVDIQKNMYYDQMKEILSLRNISETDTVYVVCRRGNDSQRAVKILQGAYPYKFKDVIGGLHSYGAKVDFRFPVY